jgi:hypothetical protein
LWMCGNTQHEGNGRLRTATRTKDRLAYYATICPEIKLNGKFTRSSQIRYQSGKKARLLLRAGVGVR